MPARRLFVLALSVGWICGGLLGPSVSAQIQAMPAITAPAAQPAPYGVPANVPPTAGASPVLPYGSVVPGMDLPAANQPGSGYMANDLGASRSDYNSLDAPAGSRPLDTNGYVERVLTGDDVWTWQFLPNGLLYRQDLASGTESRLASQWVYVRGQGWFWNPVAGGRVGLLRYGTEDDFWPQGWQLDVEGAAFPRLDAGRNMTSTDFRVGVPLTMRQGPWEFKFGYTHLSSHLGDLFMLANPDFSRINYVRDSLAAGLAVYLNPSLRFYSETGWAFHTDGGAKPWEFQFGADFSPPEPTTTLWGAPFFAINGHLRQENDFAGNFTVQTGLQWRGRTSHLFRLGAQYFNGMSEQGQFFQQFEEQIGVGLWYDY